MRVIGGQFRSRLLAAPAGTGTRPTSDRLRETLFNVLAPRLGGAYFADLYAGSGAVGIEALSRGARRVIFAEQAPAALAALRKNLTGLQLQDQATVDSRAVHRVLEAAIRDQPHWDLVFLDPPYEAATEYQATLQWFAGHDAALLAPGALIVAEHARRTGLPAVFDHLKRTRVLEQGDAALSFYAIEGSSQPPTA